MVFGVKKEIVEGLIEDAKNELKKSLAEAVKGLEKKISDSADEIKKINSSIDLVNKTTKEKFERVEKKHSQLVKETEDLTAKVKVNETAANKRMDEIKKFSKDSMEGLEKTFEKYHAAQSEAVECETRERKKLGTDFAEFKKDDAQKKAEQDQTIENLGEELRNRCQVIETELARVTLQSDATLHKVNDVVADFQRDQKRFIEEKRIQDEICTVTIPGQMKDIYDAMWSDCQKPMLDLTEKIEKTYEGVRMLDNIHTRSITWTVENFREKLYHMLTESSTIWSHNFSLCAQKMMQINLRVHPVRNNEKSTTRMANEVLQNIPVPGLLSIELWSYPGVTFAFKLTIGKISKVFEIAHEGDTEIRKVFPCANFCTLDQVWNKRKDNIQLKFELIELKNYYHDHVGPIKQPEEAEDPVTNLGMEDFLICNRHITSEVGIMDRMAKSLQGLKNRWVRQVDWEIQNIYELMEKAEVGDSLESPIFSAAAVDQLRFVFYPKGLKEPGQCSLFLSCPHHVKLKFALCIGKQRRCLEYTFTDSVADLCGKAKFCCLEQQCKARDIPGKAYCNISLEIIEVELLNEIIKEGEYSIVRRQDPSYMGEGKKVLTLPTITGSLAKVLSPPTGFNGRKGMPSPPVHEFNYTDEMLEDYYAEVEEDTALSNFTLSGAHATHKLMSSTMPSLTEKKFGKEKKKRPASTPPVGKKMSKSFTPSNLEEVLEEHEFNNKDEGCDLGGGVTQSYDLLPQLTSLG